MRSALASQETRERDEEDLKIMAFYQEGKSDTEIANIIGVSRGVILGRRQRIQRADMATGDVPAGYYDRDHTGKGGRK